MSYSITIGEARISAPEPSEADEGRQPSVRAIGATHPEAPTFPGDDMTGNGNARHPGYSAWAEFTRAVGLHDFFFDESVGVMRSHPGAAMLTQTHHARVLGALLRYRERRPDARPGWREPMDGASPFDGPWKPETEGLDPDLARLVWLEWWVRWALDNCTVPVIANT